MKTVEKTSADQSAETELEKALAALGLQFGWEGEHLFILDSEKITGQEMLVRVIPRAASIQLSVLVLESPSSEQTGVSFWQEWRRRREATFLMLDEEDKDPELLLVTRIPTKDLGQKELRSLLRAALGALSRDLGSVTSLMKEIEEYETQS